MKNELIDTPWGLAVMQTGRGFNYDGYGINGPDVYASRLATLTAEGHRLGVGFLFASSPELVKALEKANVLVGKLNYAAKVKPKEELSVWQCELETVLSEIRAALKPALTTKHIQP